MESSKVILVTGASSGFGQVIASRLAAAGHTVFGTSRKAPESGADSEHGFRLIRLDITDDASAEACLQQVQTEAGRLDVLINNAGSGIAGAIEDCSAGEVEWQMQTNLFGTIRMTRLALPIMRAQNQGRIINISSIAGHIGLPFQGIYSASKHALEGVNESLRLELMGSNIDTTVVCPGDFNTGFTDNRVFAKNANSEVHAEGLRQTIEIYEHDERNGAPPELLAELVTRLVSARKLRVRYFAGPLAQRIAVKFKRLIPSLWFEYLMQKIYKR